MTQSYCVILKISKFNCIKLLIAIEYTEQINIDMYPYNTIGQSCHMTFNSF